MIIAFGYLARSGKDTAWSYLIARHGFRRIAFADALKRAASALTDMDAFDDYFKDQMTPLGLTGGHMLQCLGMAMRREFGDDVFVHLSLLTELAKFYPDVVITDLRFPNEAAAIKRLGGFCVRIDRNVARDKHVSERSGAEIEWDYIIPNHDTVEQLYARLDTLVSFLRAPVPLPPLHVGC
ncbi:MAG: hypothetical protein E6Q97_30370 [Desulfurellales bacterium]|nr:MAG: hypothetical protein E6Q97_30370 [Desulfurellales bacterium]